MSGVAPAAEKAFGKMAVEAEKGMFATVGARRELIVLGHEALTGNFSRIPGSFMVLAERASSAGVSLMGIAAPILAVGAAAITLAKAFADGEAEIHAMNSAMVASGDYAGVTRGQMRELAASMADYGNITIGQGKEIVTQFVASGQIGGAALQKITSLVSDFAATTGEDVSKVGPQLVKLFADPAKGAEQLNQSMHFLSAAEIEHIATLQRMGDTEQAQIELADQLKSKIDGEAQSLGALPGIWNSIEKAASSAWDAMMAVGRPDTLDEKIAKLKSDLAANMNSSMPWAHTSDIQAQLAEAEAMKAKQEAQAKKKADAARAIQNGNDAASWMKNTDAYRIRELQQQKATFDKNAQVDGVSYTQQMKDQADANFARQIADIRNKGGAGSGRSESALVKAEQEAAYRAKHEALVREQEDLDRSLKNQLVSYQDYYQKKKALEQQDAQLKIDSIRNQMATAQRSVNSAASPQQKDRAQARLVTLQGELNKATEDYARIAPKVAQQSADAFNKLEDKVQSAKAAMLAAQGNTSDAEILKLHQQYDDTISQLKKNGNTAGVSIMEGLFSSKVADAKLKEVEARFNATLARMTDQENRIHVDQQAGLITKFDAGNQLKELHKATLPKLQGDLAPLDSMNTKAMNEQQLQHLDALKLKYEQVKGSVSDLNNTFAYGASSAMGQYLDQVSNAADQSGKLVSDSFKGMEDALTNFVLHGKLNFDSLAQTIVSDLLRIQVQNQIMQPLASMMNSSGASIFSSLGSMLGFGGSPAPAAVGYSAGGSDLGASTVSLASSGYMLASVHHTGGNPAVDGAASTRYVHPAYFENAPRFHTGIGPGEMAAIIQPSESVLTPGQMRQLAPVSAMQQAGPVQVVVNILGASSTPTVKQSQGQNGPQIDVMFEQIDNYIASGIKTGNGSTALAISQTFGADRTAGAVR